MRKRVRSSLAGAAFQRAADELVRRMQASGAADGIVLTGSAARGALTPSSDLDMVVLLHRPIPEFLVSTYVGGRLADVIIAGSASLKIAAGRRPPAMDSFTSWLSAWLLKGAILHDPLGIVASAVSRIRLRRTRPTRPAPGRWHAEWLSLNNNLRHNTIMTRSSDPVYRTALRIRLLYSTVEALLAYFRLRGMSWPGEKEAVRYLQRHDPNVLASLRKALGDRPLMASFGTYNKLVTDTVTHRWPRWSESTTAFQLLDARPPTAARLAACRNIWRRLTR